MHKSISNNTKLLETMHIINRFVIFFLALSIQIVFGSKNGLSDEQNAESRELYRKCLAESGVDIKLIMQGRHQDFADDENLKNYYFCMFKNFKLIDDEGTLSLDNILAKLPMERTPDFEANIKICMGEKKVDTPLEVVFDLTKCFSVKNNKPYSFE
ncbi:PREDICTED: uncharacterized protein LOC108567206 [Nicrophorus vespilloides]|uniref:Uncharacterized protein LOC108567206 n=1 Tax=Nicrophorus vespilloides TaxID=110193 RepID=A0ABM1N880_NICVS|nr:PREDICTED: uncharacterized protein LOC108567206 [Nicrophorus vespilloides]